MGSTGSTSRSSSLGGGSSATTSRTTSPNPSTPVITPANQGNPSVQGQTPNAQNTPVTQGALTALTSMNDSQMAALVRASQSADMPNYLKDGKDPTQAFTFQAGINEKPQVLSATEFAQFMSDNNIPQKEVISRSVGGGNYTNSDGTKVKLTPDEVNDIIKYSRLNYIGGKHGGKSYGSGTYFDMNGGGRTGYGSGTTSTMTAVLNPQTAKVIGWSTLHRKAQQFAVTHPQTARAIGAFNGGNAGIYALCMGYNVISSSYGAGSLHDTGEYYNVLDRKALVIKE